ncbi:MAG: DUF1566 domain-containing protein [Nitrospinaceae bacterium]
MSDEEKKEEAAPEIESPVREGKDEPDLDLDLDESLDLDDWTGEDDGEEPEDEDERLPEGPDLVDNGDNTVSDSRHNLMWQKKDSFHDFGYGINWFEANDYIEELNEKKFAGFDDWRLCSFDEAKGLFSFSVVNRDKDGAEIHIDPIFESGGGYNTWTYEEKPDYQQYAMHFSFVTGNEKWEHKDNEFTHVRAVRDEIREEWEPEWRKKTRKFDN